MAPAVSVRRWVVRHSDNDNEVMVKVWAKVRRTVLIPVLRRLEYAAVQTSVCTVCSRNM